ncbi:hypothetical protein STRIP9103_08050 [Streptomyces ipomoeae 91-03]|uniref:Uncharacterized protein n=1 Tax=Streptomyces ipomoeae 91-03 TaxID=698759 RepID=L1KZY5_9ACTN|nr:hypothetical protein STRIP9103_08050 [Streptomyces ipomoeae 91-03]
MRPGSDSPPETITTNRAPTHTVGRRDTRPLSTQGCVGRLRNPQINL